MAPISPDSLKRSTPSHSDDDITDEPQSKRRRVEPTPPQTPPVEEPPKYNISKDASFNDDPHQLLSRSVMLILEHVGFSGATSIALEALCAEVEAYAAHFLSQITSSMLNARRALPTPLDWDYALSQFDLPLGWLSSHLKPPVPKSKSQIKLESLPAEESEKQKEDRLALLLGAELSGESDKKTKSYIPKKFIPFPSRHTYKWTEKESSRVTDPRKIREQAAKDARFGEEALRRLHKVSRVGKEKDIKRAANKNPQSKENHELWEKALDDLQKGFHPSLLGKAGDYEDNAMIVNAESQYFRRGPSKKKALAADTIRVEGP